MPQGQRTDPYKNFKFLVEIEGIAVAGFSECEGLTTEVSVIEYREGNEDITVRKLPGLVKYSNITLKKGITGSKDLFNWYKEVVKGKIKQIRRNMAIVLLDDEGNQAVRWVVRNAWPMKYTGPTLNAKSSEVAIETLEIAHEGFELE